jgi:putative ABC transport system permease protein
LLLGCIGVSSAVHVFVQEKLVSVAILRCLGARAIQTFFIFLVQFAGIGLIGGFVGAILGGLIQYMIPLVMQSFIPFELTSFISWRAVAEGIGVGVVIAILFALLPLVAVRHVSPLNTLRVSESQASFVKDGLRWLIVFCIVGFVMLFTYTQLEDWLKTIAFCFAVLVIFLLFYAIAKLLTWGLRKFFPKRFPYVWRQGLANLFRPRNQTLVLLISIGLGTAMVSTLWFIQDLLVSRVQIAADEAKANMLLFDIQPSQIEEIKQKTLVAGYPIIDEVPIVTVQLTGIKGVSAEELITDTADLSESRAVNREIRATYREVLSSSDKVVSGEWVPRTLPGELASVSLEIGYAKRLDVKVGDSVEFDMFGVIIPARVTSLREVKWNQFSTNFRVVFSAGVLEDAPKFFVIMTRIDEPSDVAIFQQEIVKAYPNVSVVDMESIMNVLAELMEKIAFVIQFLGGFSILTGLVVLIASIRISKFQRIRDNVLLRTLGANRRQVFMINASEYFILGVMAALVGLFVSIGITSLLGAFVFEFTFVPNIGVTLVMIIFVAMLTTIIGLLNSLVALNRPPLEVLRKE